MPPPPPPSILVLNGALKDTAAPLDWLKSAPRGAYTVARTVRNGRAVFGLAAHLHRLAGSAAALPRMPAPAPPAATDAGLLRPALVAGMATALRAAREAAGGGGGGAGGDWKITALLTWSPGGGEGGEGGSPPPPPVDLYVHASPLPPRPTPPVAVLVAGGPRAVPGAKDSAWATSGRVELEAMKTAAGVEEVVLARRGDGGSEELVEGLSSNFAVLLAAPADGSGGGGEEAATTATSGAAPSPVTLIAPGAGSGALAGTVRTALATAAEAAGLAVIDAPVRVADAGRWRGAFVCSTSRGALPVSRVLWPEGPSGEAPSHGPVVLAPTNPVVDALDRAVADAMDAAGEEVE